MLRERNKNKRTKDIENKNKENQADETWIKPWKEK